MIKKSYVASLLVAAVILQGAVCSYSAEPTALEQAKAYWDNGDYAQAETKYLQISNSAPGTALDFAARKQLILMHITTETTQTEDVVNKLTSDFSTDSNLPSALYEIADAYETPNWFDKAQGVYQRIIEQCPNTPEAQKAKFDIAKLKVREALRTGDFAGAKAGMAKLTADYAGNAGLPEALHRFAIAYEWSQQYDDAINIYQQIIQQDGNSPAASKAGLDIARISILRVLKSGDYVQAQDAIQKLGTSFPNHSDMAETLYFIASRFVWNDKGVNYEGARDVYRQIATNYPNTYYGRKAKLEAEGMNVMVLMDANSYSQADTAINSLIANFSNHPDLPLTLFWIGHKYYMDARAPGYDEKATSIFTNIRNNFPALGKTPEACCRIGDMYVEKGEWAKAADCYQGVADTFTEYPAGWHGLRMAAMCYENLGTSGGLSKSEAESKIRTAYGLILTRYPDSEAVGQAEAWLKR